MKAPHLLQNYGTLMHLIGNEWKASRGDASQQVYDPGRGVPIAQVPFATKDEVDEAVTTSYEAFTGWRELPIGERLKYLFKIRNLLLDHFEELAAVNTQNNGKTIHESRADLRRTIENVDMAIAVAQTLAKGEVLPQIAEGVDESVVKEPLGVFAIVTPFNFPIMIPFWFIPYAIVLGNTVVVKPSEIAPVPTVYVMKLIQEEVKLPPGVINLVHGSREAVEALISHKLTCGVAFVGSTPVAKSIYKMAGEHGKRVLANGGAKNSIVVMPDADLSRTIPSIVSSFFGNAGQRCLAGSNLLAVGEIHETLVRKFSQAARELRVGYGLDEQTEMGPVISSSAKRRIMGYIESGISEGAKLILDGRNIHVVNYPEGFYLGPTIFDDVSPDMPIAKHEIFGPVASVIPVQDLDQAIELINNGTEYGNMASIFTSSGRTAREFARRVNAGNIGVNIGVAAPAASFPFGGRKESFFGILHAQSDTVDFFTDKKVIITRW